MCLKFTKLPNRYSCMCTLTYLYASLQFLIQRKGKNFVRSPPDVYIDDCSNHARPISILTRPFIVCVHPFNIPASPFTMSAHSFNINKLTYSIPATQTLIVHVHSIQAKTWHVTTQEKCKYTNTSLIHACRFQVSLHAYIRMLTTVNSSKSAAIVYTTLFQLC